MLKTLKPLPMLNSAISPIGCYLSYSVVNKPSQVKPLAAKVQIPDIMIGLN